MSYFWFSFSYEGKNQGCINIQSDTESEAQKKIIKLKIVPKYDDVFVCEIFELELPLDILIIPEKMRSMDYESDKDIIVNALNNELIIKNN